jgi:hypothetical protein
MYLIFPHKPIYTLENGRTFQVNNYGTVFCVSDIVDDPDLPGYMDLTEAICSPTYEEQKQVLEMVSK